MVILPLFVAATDHIDSRLPIRGPLRFDTDGSQGLNRVCRKIRDKHHFEYELNAILSVLIYTRILEPSSKCSSYAAAKNFLESPEYQLHDVYQALSVLAEESVLIQSEVYKHSNFLMTRNDHILYYDCTNYYFEIDQEDGDKKYFPVPGQSE